jgi:hypothetical protein
MAADYAVNLLTHGEVQFYPGFILTGVNQVVIILSPALSPQRPGDSVNQSRFTVAVIAADAGGMDAVKMERRRLPVAHEIVHGELNGNHRVLNLVIVAQSEDLLRHYYMGVCTL